MSNRKRLLSAGQIRLEQEEDLIPAAFFGELVHYNVIPKSRQEAKIDRSRYESLQTEYKSQLERNFLELVDSLRVKPAGGRWNFPLKCGPSRETVGYKARLVAEGFSQVPERDF